MTLEFLKSSARRGSTTSLELLGEAANKSAAIFLECLPIFMHHLPPRLPERAGGQANQNQNQNLLRKSHLCAELALFGIAKGAIHEDTVTTHARESLCEVRPPNVVLVDFLDQHLLVQIRTCPQ
ncbi:hypothetical protein D9758_017996 [Tetrapyrgos nigripes]|uniref:Uncharacterized protein n=1 Tax=Tetrapyrgos nigripes TaxID=182062 RepID=A0A8H5B5B8_9AGAR|nr:hypothetical protein D9758_017996 [Tetrapyrgos nigripes]